MQLTRSSVAIKMVHFPLLATKFRQRQDPVPSCPSSACPSQWSPSARRSALGCPGTREKVSGGKSMGKSIETVGKSMETLGFHVILRFFTKQQEKLRKSMESNLKSHAEVSVDGFWKMNEKSLKTAVIGWCFIMSVF